MYRKWCAGIIGKQRKEVPLLVWLFSSPPIWWLQHTEMSEVSGAVPLPKRIVIREFARRHCPDRIIHPHPVSEVNPCWSVRLLKRTESVIDASDDFLIGEKFERYVNHGRASQSSRKSFGQPLSAFPSSLWASSFGAETPFSVAFGTALGTDSKLSAKVSLCFPDSGSCDPWPFGSGGLDLYAVPRHHISDPKTPSFLGSGSKKRCTIRL